jgi:hypothetical protein
MDASENKLNKDSKRGNGKREKNTKLMVQQLAGEAIEKNKKRVQQLVGKEIHRLETDKLKEKVFGCKLKKNRSFSISGHTKNRGQLLHNESHVKSGKSYL